MTNAEMNKRPAVVAEPGAPKKPAKSNGKSVAPKKKAKKPSKSAAPRGESKGAKILRPDRTRQGRDTR